MQSKTPYLQPKQNSVIMNGEEFQRRIQSHVKNILAAYNVESFTGYHIAGVNAILNCIVKANKGKQMTERLLTDIKLVLKNKIQEFLD